MAEFLPCFSRETGHSGGMTTVDGILNVLAANALTLALVYGLWRIRRDEGDVVGLLITLAPLVAVAVMAFAAWRIA
jgi:hypothetical protein